MATKLNPSLLANRTPSASNKPLPTDGLFPAHTLDLSLSAVQRCRPGWAGPRRHSPPRARSPSRPSSSSPARLSGAPVTSFFDRSAVQRCRPARAGPRRHSLGAISSLPPRALELLYGPPQRRPGHILFRPVSRSPTPAQVTSTKTKQKPYTCFPRRSHAQASGLQVTSTTTSAHAQARDLQATSATTSAHTLTNPGPSDLI